MQKIITSISTTLILFVSCKQTPNQSSNLHPSATKADTINQQQNPQISNTTYFDYQHTNLSENIADTAYALFSNDESQDCFTLHVPSGPITETKTTISITNIKGDVIYEHIFPTRDLINGYDLDKINSDAEMEEYIIWKANSLLKEGLFNPSDKPEDVFPNNSDPADFNDYALYTTIKHSKRVIFFYGLQEESLYYLGFSDKTKKVVEIINCC